jgi:hypothetical protein
MFLVAFYPVAVGAEQLKQMRIFEHRPEELVTVFELFTMFTTTTIPVIDLKGSPI